MNQTLIVEELLVQSAVMGRNAMKTLIAALILVWLVYVVRSNIVGCNSEINVSFQNLLHPFLVLYPPSLTPLQPLFLSSVVSFFSSVVSFFFP
jgi:hypothetical protein